MCTCSAILVALLTFGCAYQNPDAPSSTVAPISTTAPFSLMLGATVGMGADAGLATVTAKVQNVNGAPLDGVTVSFATDTGTLSATSGVTSANGQATTTLSATRSASITATAGTLTSYTLVASQPASAVPTPSPTPTPTPTPGAPPVGPLSVTLTTADVTVGAQTLFSANVKNGPAVSFVWSFGDGATFTGQSQTTAHTYGAAGTGVASVRITDALGRSASGSTTVTVKPPPPDPPAAPAPPPALTATLTASPTTVGFGGTLTFTVAIKNLNVAADEKITAYQWDLDGDGKLESTSTVETRPFVYLNAGLFTARVVATTSSGRQVTGTVGVVITN